MKYTKLTIIQKGLSALDSDNVSSSDETIESEQIAEILESNHNEILMEYPWPHLYQTTTLEVTTTPHIMKIPNDVLQIDWVRYNKTDVSYIPYEAMLVMLDNRNTDDSNVDVNGAYTDRDPRYWTSLDNINIIFDSYNESLMSSLSKCKSVREPNNLENDIDYPDFPSRFHPVLLNAVLRDVYLQLKGDDSMAAYYEQRYKYGLIRMKRWAKKVNIDLGPGGSIDYGRKVFGQRRIISTDCVHDS